MPPDVIGGFSAEGHLGVRRHVLHFTRLYTSVQWPENGEAIRECSADWQSAVSRIGNPLKRRKQPGQTQNLNRFMADFEISNPPQLPAPCRLPAGDTAYCQSALLPQEMRVRCWACRRFWTRRQVLEFNLVHQPNVTDNFGIHGSQNRGLLIACRPSGVLTHWDTDSQNRPKDRTLS